MGIGGGGGGDEAGEMARDGGRETLRVTEPLASVLDLLSPSMPYTTTCNEAKGEKD